MALAAGSNFGPYRVIEQLGRGGMASVYRAYEAALDRYVALKVLPTEFLHEETFAERFEREAKVVAKLEHPNIIPIFSYGIEGSIPWMAMRLVPGGTLSSLLKRGRLSLGEIARVTRGVAEALEYAHGKGVVHRDVKPQNILLDESGRVYLADFGIARMVEGTSALTQTGMISGTPYYMAPEQATGGTVDHRCDIYALGVVVYEMLTGRVPFTADTPVAVLMKQVSEPIPLPPVTEVPEAVFRPVLKCLAKKPEERWRQAGEFALAIEHGLSHAAAVAHTGAVLPATAPGTLSPTLPTRAMPTLPPPPATVPAAPGRAQPAKRGGLFLPVALGIAALVVMVVGAAGIFVMTRDRGAPVVDTTTPITSTPTPPSASAEVRVDPRPDTPPSSPAATAAPPSAGGPEHRPPSAPVAQAAVLPAAPPTAPALSSAATVPAVAAAPSLEVDLDIVQDPEGPWAASVLYVHLKVGERVKSTAVSFGGEARRREPLVIPEVPMGAQRLQVTVSKSRGMESEATVQGVKEIALREGVNRLGLEVRFLGPEDWTIRFR